MTPISAAAVARSRALGEARWSPDATRLAWLDAFGGRVDLVVAPTDRSTGAATLLSAEFPVTTLGAYGGGGYCWASDDTLVYAAADGRLLADRGDGRTGARALTRRARRGADRRPGR